MKSREQRERELIDSGLVDSVKAQFRNVNHNISDKYFILIADYIDSIGQLDFEGGLYLDPVNVAKSLPQLLSSVMDVNLGGIHGRTTDDERTNKSKIEMNSTMDYQSTKLYFFHELTHALQTRKIDNHEECAFYNGKTGMFLTEGATQFIAEILYNVSNGTNIQYRQQPGTVRGHREHIPYSALSEYQLNGNIIMLLSASLGIPLNQILALGYRKDGRQQLKEMYEVIPGNEGKFEEFMFELEQIYSIDKLLIAGYGNQLQGAPLNIEMQDGQTFVGNIQTQGDLINKVERELAASFLANNETDYVLANYNKVAQYLTTPQLQQSFMNAINEIATMQNSNIQEQTQSGPRK